MQHLVHHQTSINQLIATRQQQGERVRNQAVHQGSAMLATRMVGLSSTNSFMKITFRDELHSGTNEVMLHQN
jgi:ribosomal protein S2